MISVNQLITGRCKNINRNRRCQKVKQVNQWRSDNSVLEVDEECVDEFISLIFEENVASVKIPVVENFKSLNGARVVFNYFWDGTC